MSLDTITAIAATVIAIVALVYTIKEQRESREHDFLSVRPYLSVAWDDYRKFYISNKGLGPAIVREQFFLVDDQLMPTNNFRGTFETLAQLGLPTNGIFGLHYWIAGSAILPNEQAIPTFYFSGTHISQGDLQLFNQAEKRLRIELICESAYGVEHGDALITNILSASP